MKRIPRLAIAVLALGLTSACSTMRPPADLDVRMSKPSVAALYRVAIHPVIDKPAVNQMHDWEIEITTAKGEPVADANFAFSGGMPQHHHGFPTKPRVTEALGSGRYLLGGVKFSMTGWWQIKLDIVAAQGSDTVTFNTVLPDSAASSLQAARQ